MVVKIKGAAAILTLFLLSGCAAGSSDIERVREASKKPESRAEITARCRAHVKFYDPSLKNEYASLMGVSVDRVPEVMCERLVAAIASGRFTEEDMRGLRLGKGKRTMEIMKGG